MEVYHINVVSVNVGSENLIKSFPKNKEIYFVFFNKSVPMFLRESKAHSSLVMNIWYENNRKVLEKNTDEK